MLWCCACQAEVDARLTDGKEIYPHRPDLSRLPFWKCDVCKNFVGCHHKTQERTKPLGCIPDPAMKKARQWIHHVLDPIWKTGRMKRSTAYQRLSKVLGRDYHTADLRTMDEVRLIWNEITHKFPKPRTSK